MANEYTKNIEEIVTHGFKEIDPQETVEVNLKELLYVYCTLQEYQRFFHQPAHYNNLEDVKTFMGTLNDNGGFKLIHTAIHEKMGKMLPPHINELFDEGAFC